MYSVQDLVSLLASTKIIVSESGTSTLIAQLFSPISTRILSLVPSRLIQEPDAAMTHSGLHYHLAIPCKINFLEGETVKLAHSVVGYC